MTVPQAHALAADVGDLLRERRRAMGLTQEALAERAGISPRSISDLERGGPHTPRRDTLALLARALDLQGDARDRLESMVSEHRDRATANLEEGRRTRNAIDRPKHNIPRSLTRFIGREHDLDGLSSLVADRPLLTLIGPGGVGKTRLAEELARRNQASFADGCWVVELAGLSDRELMPVAIARGIGLREIASEHMLRRLTSYIGQKRLLLVLDNCEHLVEACADVVTELLSHCPGLHVLATSREPLSIAGETRWHVLPFAVPARAAFDELQNNPAVQLFLDRAASLDTIHLTRENASAVARICVSVDGVPLALELAAATTRILSLNELAERLESDPRSLTSPNREAPTRHHTLQATIDWSHDLLSDPQRVMLRRLAVFSAGWTLEAAEEVCAGDAIKRSEVLEVLAQLLDKSLVVVDANGTAARYRLLEPVRQYALERLEAAGESDRFQQQHAAFFLAFARGGPNYPAGPDELNFIARLDPEHANLRAALHWAVSHDQTESALRAATCLFQFWERRGYFEEGSCWLEQALAGANESNTPMAVRAAAMNALAFLYWRGGDADRAEPVARDALAISRAAECVPELAHSLLNLGMSAFLKHQYAPSQTYLEQCINYARESGRSTVQSVALAFLARVLLLSNESVPERAVELIRESLSLSRAAQSRYASAHALSTWGDVLWAQDNYAGAIRAWKAALTVVSDLADTRGIAGVLERMAVALMHRGFMEAATWVLGAADAVHAPIGMQLRKGERIDHAHFVQYEQQQNLRQAFPHAWLAGHAVPTREAVAMAIQYTQEG